MLLKSASRSLDTALSLEVPRLVYRLFISERREVASPIW